MDEEWSAVDKLVQMEASPTAFPSRPETERVRINVSGLVFETSVQSLEQHPTTLLGSREKRAHYWVEQKTEYFFDRHRPSFDAIFAYLVEGCSLKRPPLVPSEVFLKEVWFLFIYQLSQAACMNAVSQPPPHCV